MALSPGRRAAITVLVTAAFGGALYFALRGQQQEQAAQIEQQEGASATVLRGVISLDVEGYFKDPRVQKVLAARRLPVEVVRVGSREMASRVVAGSAPDFFFTSGVVSANQIVEAARKANLPAVQVAPFNSPLVIASWEPIAKILVNGTKAWQLFQKHDAAYLSIAHPLPSTSPANAAVSWEERLRWFRALRDFVGD